MKLVERNDPVLRLKARPVEKSEFGSKELRQLLSDMSRILAAEPDGIALAAPQIGVSKSLFIVSAKVLGESGSEKKDLVFINPQLIKTSKKKQLVEEGCLSLRWLYGHVARAEKASVEAYDEMGKKFIRHGSDLMAQIFQHEMEHLAGILFIDQAENIQEIKPEDQIND